MIADARLDAARTGARRSYEWAMLRLGVVRAAVVTAAVAALAAMGLTRLPSIAWLAAIFLVWLLMGWRGSLIWRGALSGLVAGLAAVTLPMSVLRPCCATMTGAASCSMPEVCVAAGGALGLFVAVTLPRLRTSGQWLRAGAGGLVAVASLVACRCTTMLLGDTAGLVGGLLASATAVGLARAWWARRKGAALAG